MIGDLQNKRKITELVIMNYLRSLNIHLFTSSILQITSILCNNYT